MLIISTIVISRQVQFVQSANLGYDRENLVYIPLEGDLPKKYDVFKEQALASSGISSVSRMTQSPTSIQNGTTGVDWEGKDPNSALQFTQAGIGYDFVKTLDVKLAGGRDFSKDRADTANYVINETAARIFNYKEPVGMPLTFWGKKGTIIGVVRDFHFDSFHEPIRPIIMRIGEKEDYGLVLVRTEAGKTKEALATLERLCRELNPSFPFTYQFSDQEYDKLYRSEQVVSTLSNGFAFLAIFISCLGLLGLAMFTAEQRTKEVGIRKVLGASIHSLFGLLSKEMLMLVTIAMLIASPLAWYAMDTWLKDYAYRTEISFWIFIASGVTAVVIALITISFQTMKALLSNPVQSLRSE
jgi:putative ABC transport system permease protein